MHPRTLSRIAGGSYLVIFFAAVFANFFVLEALEEAPLLTVREAPTLVRGGIVAFLITVVFDVVVAWALYELFPRHPLSKPSTLFRLMHAVIMGVALYTLPMTLRAATAEEVLLRVADFNTIWLIGLFFFGIHLILLSIILRKPRIIAWFLALAGAMYMIDTLAHFLLPSYEAYAAVFLALVAVPSILGEMALALWLLFEGGAPTLKPQRT